jgi:RNA polymerase sigma factor (sigma-70 family)
MDIDNKFIKQYRNLIYNLIRKGGIRHRESIDEVFGNTIIRIINHNNYDESKGAISTWLTYVTRSVIYNYLDHHTRSEDALDQAKVPISSLSNKHSGQLSARQDLKSILKHSQLSDKQKEILYLKYVMGETYHNISIKLNLNFENVRKISFRSMKQLEKEYDQQEIDSGNRINPKGT